MDLIDQIERDEGFREKPYKCTSDVWTFGHGFTYLTIEESRAVLKIRIESLRSILHQSINDLSPARQDVIVNMAFNLGVTGLFKFKRMWTALYQKDYNWAASEMLDSKWAKQVKGRAVRLADTMRRG